jgi:hypothetical protein
MSSKSLRAGAISAMAASAMIGWTASSRAESVQELQAQVDALTARRGEG